MQSNAPFTVSFNGHLMASDRDTLAMAPLYDYERQAWTEGHDHGHYGDADCEGPILLCRVAAARCPEFLAEWGEGEAVTAAADLVDHCERLAVSA